MVVLRRLNCAAEVRWKIDVRFFLEIFFNGYLNPYRYPMKFKSAIVGQTKGCIVTSMVWWNLLSQMMVDSFGAETKLWIVQNVLEIGIPSRAVVTNLSDLTDH